MGPQGLLSLPLFLLWLWGGALTAGGGNVTVAGDHWEALEGTSFLESSSHGLKCTHFICIFAFPMFFSSAGSDWIHHRLTFSIIRYNVFFLNQISLHRLLSL